MSTVFLSLEEIKTEVKSIAIDVEYLKDEFMYIKENMATKEDLKNFATKDDLKKYATKDDLKNFATKDDIANFATKADVIEIIEATFKKYLPHISSGSAQI